MASPISNLILRPESSTVKRVVKIKFPAGKTFADFQADQGMWLDGNQWLEFLGRSQKTGQLSELRKRVLSDGVEYTYTFPSLEAHDAFVKTSRALASYKEQTKNELGYISDVSLKA